jgi:hypothetical protein
MSNDMETESQHDSASFFHSHHMVGWPVVQWLMAPGLASSDFEVVRRPYTDIELGAMISHVWHEL